MVVADGSSGTITVSTTEREAAGSHAEYVGLSHLVTYERVDAMHMPYAQGSFDAAWAMESLVHMADPPAAVREINRVLTFGAPFVLTDLVELQPMPEEVRARWVAQSMAFSLQTPDALLELLRDGGFEITEVHDLTSQVQQTHTRRSELVSTRRADLLEREGEKLPLGLASSANTGDEQDYQEYFAYLGYALIVARAGLAP